MRRFVAVICLVSLAGCTDAQPIDCRAVYEDLDACIERVTIAGEELQWDACVPYSEPSIVTGRYVVDWEFDQFWEGPYSDQHRMWEIPDVATRLHWNRPIPTNAQDQQVATVTEMTFVTRRPLCLITAKEQWLTVDRIIDQKIIWSGQWAGIDKYFVPPP